MDKKRDKERFAQVMVALSEVFDAGKEVTDLRMEIYFTALASFTMEQVEAASMVILKTRTTSTMPKPGEIIEAIKGGPEDKRAAQAWELVDRTMRTIGNYQSINFGDPKIHRVVDMLGGWVYLGTLTEEDWKWKRKEFESAYRAIQDDGGPGHIAGLVEQVNTPLGYQVPDPVQVGSGRRLLQ